MKSKSIRKSIEKIKVFLPFTYTTILINEVGVDSNHGVHFNVVKLCEYRTYENKDVPIQHMLLPQ